MIKRRNKKRKKQRLRQKSIILLSINSFLLEIGYLRSSKDRRKKLKPKNEKCKNSEMNCNKKRSKQKFESKRKPSF